MKRYLSLLLAALMLVSLLPSLALANEDVPTFVITIRTHAFVTDWYDNYLTNWIEDTYGCNLEFQFLPASETDAQSKLNVMVAGGEDLGDIILWQGLEKSVIANYADAGAILDMADYFAQQDTNLEAVAEEVGIDFLASISTPDGGIYGYPIYYPEANNMTKYRAWMNQAWLDNLGLEQPTTTDELYEVLKAFKEQDANGNGDLNDEIPMLGCAAGWSTDPTPFLISSFVYWDDDLMLNIDENGQISPAYVSEKYREGLAFMKKLVDEGLLAVDTYSISYTQYQEYLNTEDSSVGVHFFTHLGDMDTTRDNHLEYEYLPYLLDDNGVQRISYQPYDVSQQQTFFITADAEDPDGCFDFINWLFSEEAYIRARFGVEGEHYDKITDEETLEQLGNDRGFAVLEYDVGWDESCNMAWMQNLGYFTGSGYMCQWNGDPSYYFYKRLIAVNHMLTLAPKAGEYVPSLNYTTEELEEYNELSNNITTYWEQCKTLFVLGEMDLDTDWDSYIETLKNDMNLSRYLELIQTAYDRQFKSE